MILSTIAGLALCFATGVFAQTKFPYNDRNNYFLEPPRASIDTVYTEAVTYTVGDPKTFRWVDNFSYPVDVFLYQEQGKPYLIASDVTSQSVDWNGTIAFNFSIGRIFFVSLFDKQNKYIMRSQYIRFNDSSSTSSSSSSSSTSTSSATSSATSSSSGTAVPASVSATTTSTPTGSSSGGSNHKGVALGAGLGVGLGVLALLAIGALLFWRRRKRQMTPRKSIPEVQQLAGNDMDGHMRSPRY